jgi:hypothetical protein
MKRKTNNEARAGLPAGVLFSVFRVQDKDGRGPFKPGFSSTWVEDRDDHDNLVPWFVEMGRVDLQMIVGMSGGTACRTLDQLRRWFTPSEYKTLRRHGYHAVQLDAGRIIGESAIQLFFERCRPLKDGATPVELYPENAIGHPAADGQPEIHDFDKFRHGVEEEWKAGKHPKSK